MHLRSRSLLLAGLLIVALLAGAAAVYAYDDSHKRRIAEGVRVNGVDVGGMSAAEARSALRAALLEPLDRPVVARYEGRKFTLTPEQASIGVDIDGSVSRALIRSRQGNMFSRTWREVRGEQLNVDLDAKITWSRPAVRRLVTRIQKKLDKKPVNATVDLASGRIEPTPSRSGLAVKAKRLHRDLERELLDAGERRVVRVRTEVVQPETTTKDLADKYPAVIVVNRSAFQLTLYKKLKPAKTYGIAVGQVGLETPAGLYNVQNKAVNPAWTMPNSDWVAPADRGKVVPGGTPENPLKARWLGVYDGVGIHGTGDPGSIGTNASHGCIRMRVPEVVELYDQVPVGAPIYIS
jgi:lipoprotein-anchoring transpeptidase ErfK/SrfK